MPTCALNPGIHKTLCWSLCSGLGLNHYQRFVAKYSNKYGRRVNAFIRSIRILCTLAYSSAIQIFGYYPEEKDSEIYVY
ncbi:hypothetical protein XENTR_v10006368 [Xenopus tropicalis]|nr:hypothetical protein XENTR_v10006368 [Xenopus tropicalis]